MDAKPSEGSSTVLTQLLTTYLLLAKKKNNFEWNKIDEITVVKSSNNGTNQNCVFLDKMQ